MTKTALTKVNRTVYRRFPEMRGVRPKVRERQQFIRLIYTAKAETADGRKLTRTVRVLATAQGKTLKITTSH